MDYEIVLSAQVIKYLKKIREKKLKMKIISILYDEIAMNPYGVGIEKKSDLINIWTVGFRYAKTDYRIAYTIEKNKVIPILLIGTHENFYQELKRQIKNK